MLVALINGSPRSTGCTHTALTEVAKSLETHGVDSEMLHIGTQPMQGCVACMRCLRGENRCAFNDEVYTKALDLVSRADALVVGSPVYFAGPNGSLCALLDRLFFSAGKQMAYKPAAAVASCRRGGATATLDRLNKYFTLNKMPVVSSQYWNIVHGLKASDVLQDLEGLQTMRTLGQNMAWMLKNFEKAGLDLPVLEERVATNFIR